MLPRFVLVFGGRLMRRRSPVYLAYYGRVSLPAYFVYDVHRREVCFVCFYSKREFSMGLSWYNLGIVHPYPPAADALVVCTSSSFQVGV